MGTAFSLLVFAVLCCKGTFCCEAENWLGRQPARNVHLAAKVEENRATEHKRNMVGCTNPTVAPGNAISLFLPLCVSFFLCLSFVWPFIRVPSTCFYLCRALPLRFGQFCERNVNTSTKQNGVLFSLSRPCGRKHDGSRFFLVMAWISFLAACSY